MSTMTNYFVNKNIENELNDVVYDFESKVMKKDRVKYYSYIVTLFDGTKYLVPIDCNIFVPYVKGAFQKSITTSIINLVTQVNENITCYPILNNNIFTFDIKSGKTEIKNNFSVTFLDEKNTISELNTSETMKLRDSDELFKLLSEEEADISAAIKKAEYDSIENPFTKWWMEQDELKISKDTWGSL